MSHRRSPLGALWWPHARARTAFGLAVAVAVLTAAGCGGADLQDVLESSADTSNPSGGTSGTGGDAGTSGGSGGAAGRTDAAVDAAAACPQEEEPNDSEESATVLAPTLCGVLQPGSESDFLTFELKRTSTTLQLKFDGKVRLTVDVDGTTVTLGAGNFKVPFVKGERYVVEVEAAERGSAPVPWRVDLIEQ